MARCQSCEVVYINGIRCHETGCPDAWLDYQIECRWCGTPFKPEDRWQLYCCDDCNAADYGAGEYFDEVNQWEY